MTLWDMDDRLFERHDDRLRVGSLEGEHRRVRVHRIDDAEPSLGDARKPVPGEKDVVDVHDPAVHGRLVVELDALPQL